MEVKDCSTWRKLVNGSEDRLPRAERCVQNHIHEYEHLQRFSNLVHTENAVVIFPESPICGTLEYADIPSHCVGRLICT